MPPCDEVNGPSFVSTSKSHRLAPEPLTVAAKHKTFPPSECALPKIVPKDNFTEFRREDNVSVVARHRGGALGYWPLLLSHDQPPVEGRLRSDYQKCLAFATPGAPCSSRPPVTYRAAEAAAATSPWAILTSEEATQWSRPGLRPVGTQPGRCLASEAPTGCSVERPHHLRPADRPPRERW